MTPCSDIIFALVSFLLNCEFPGMATNWVIYGVTADKMYFIVSRNAINFVISNTYATNYTNFNKKFIYEYIEIFP